MRENGFVMEGSAGDSHGGDGERIFSICVGFQAFKWCERYVDTVAHLKSCVLDFYQLMETRPG